MVYIADPDIYHIRELFSVPIDGSSVEVKLNGSVSDSTEVTDFRVSSDSEYVIYRDAVDDIYSRRLGGEGPAV